MSSLFLKAQIRDSRLNFPQPRRRGPLNLDALLAQCASPCRERRCFARSASQVHGAAASIASVDTGERLQLLSPLGMELRSQAAKLLRRMLPGVDVGSGQDAGAGPDRFAARLALI